MPPTDKTDYARVERAIHYLDTNFRRQPGLGEIAAAVGLSPFHFQRLFRRWAGVSPKRFLQFLTAEYAAALLRDRHTVLDAGYAAGLSGAGRLHDLMVNLHAVSPGELRRRGAGLRLRYGVHASPFGDCLLAVTERGVCGLSFLAGGDREAEIDALGARWPGARLQRAPDATRRVADRVFPVRRGGGARVVDLHVAGTNFQIKVWEALLRVPPGAVTSYGALAAGLGSPRAARAVGTAVGQNPVAFLIPCHRVIRLSGAFGEYRWGAARKQAMLAWEAARSQP
ncbi:MAG TPA: methylated-DNA--[protein]-cysteine S-methyltransferase [Acidiferrobacterales bacterium]